MIKLNKKTRLTDKGFGFILVVPALILLSIVLIIPSIRSVIISFTDSSLLSIDSSNWIGLKNYIDIFQSKHIYEIVLNTLIFVFSTVVIQFILGFGVALLINLLKRYRNLFSGIILFNWITPSVVASFIWVWIFQANYGILNYILYKLGIISNNIVWISHPNFAMLTIIVTSVWKSYPFMMIMLLAGLQTIPDDIIDASSIDGAGNIQRFFHITIPYLRNIIMITTLLGLVSLFQSFTIIWIVTGGGPMEKTSTLALDVHKRAFELYDLGSASAIGVVWLFFLIIISFFYIYIIGKKNID